MSVRRDNADGREAGRNGDWLNVVRQHVASLRFGVVQIVIHDSKVVQVDKTEKMRFDSAEAGRRLLCRA